MDDARVPACGAPSATVRDTRSLVINLGASSSAADLGHARADSSNGGAVERALAPCLARHAPEPLAREFLRQGAFLYLEQVLSPELVGQLVDAVQAVSPQVNRNYLPGHKQGGSVSRHTIDDLVPFIGELYRSSRLLEWLSAIAGVSVAPSPPDDPHAYAFYFYSRPGDHIGWHYDTSYYRGRRFTVLLGVVDRSSCSLDYELHTRDPNTASSAGSIRYPPGALVFFDGDKLRHRVTPLAAGETRVSLTFEYVTDARMSAGWRFVSNMKDAVAYFGLRQVFRR